MATNTTNYNLVKPTLNETADIEVINSNMDIIDTNLKKIEEATTNINVPVKSVNSKTGEVILNKDDVGLGNVNNWPTSSEVNNPSDTVYATAGAVKKAYDKALEAFQSASNGKTKIAAAITGKGVATSSTDTFDAMVANINNIETGISVNAQLMTVAAEEPISKGDFIQFNNGQEVSISESNLIPGIAINSQHVAVFNETNLSICIYKLAGSTFTKVTEKQIFSSTDVSNYSYIFSDMKKINDKIITTILLTDKTTYKIKTFNILVSIDFNYNLTLINNLYVDIDSVFRYIDSFGISKIELMSNNRLVYSIKSDTSTFLIILTLSGNSLLLSKIIDLNIRTYKSITITSNNNNIIGLSCFHFDDYQIIYIKLNSDNSIITSIATKSIGSAYSIGTFGLICVSDYKFIVCYKKSIYGSSSDTYTELYYTVYTFGTDGTLNTSKDSSVYGGSYHDSYYGDCIKISDNKYFFISSESVGSFGGSYYYCYLSEDNLTLIDSGLGSSQFDMNAITKHQYCLLSDSILLARNESSYDRKVKILDFINNEPKKYKSKSVKKYVTSMNGIAGSSGSVGDMINVYYK